MNKDSEQTDRSAKLPVQTVSQLDQAEALWEFAGRCIANYYNTLVAEGVSVEIAQILAVNAAQIFLAKLIGSAPAEG
jgi:hypothetical protein